MIISPSSMTERQGVVIPGLSLLDSYITKQALTLFLMHLTFRPSVGSIEKCRFLPSKWCSRGTAYGLSPSIRVRTPDDALFMRSITSDSSIVPEPLEAILR